MNFNSDKNTPSLRLPDGTLPVLGTWFWWDKEFEPGGYREFIDHATEHSPINALTASIRAAKEITDPAVCEHIHNAAEYAKSRGIKLVMDLDIRLARSEFKKRYPDELQEMLRLREVELDPNKPTSVSIESVYLADHYTMSHTPYSAVAGRLERVYSYVRGPKGIKPDTLIDITSQCKIEEASASRVSVSIPHDAGESRTVCVMAVFTHFMMDVFAPHLLEYQREVLKRYADAPIYGACKDEWGFPPCFDGWPEKDNYWFSRYYADAYRKMNKGCDLVRDCLLMYAGEEGRERERIAAVNAYMKLNHERNAEVEADYYDAVKEIWGPSALVCTHPTWWPVPDAHEFMKNGLHWWVAKRDLAQTDEITPLSARTALAKKWGSAVWYNMFYSSDKKDYRREMWSDCLVGGRVNYHPVYPEPEGTPLDPDRTDLFRGRLMRGESRIRLLNLIVKTPLDCPATVVFGHTCAMNWAGPGYNDVGLKLAEALWKAGYPADLIPSSEIENGSLNVDADGYARYGAQRYSALVIYHPEFETRSTLEFIKKASAGKTALYYTGQWTRDFFGNPFDASQALKEMRVLPEDLDNSVNDIVCRLREVGIEPQVHSVDTQNAVWYKYAAPPTKGECRLLDGTRVFVSVSSEPEGDPISGVLSVDGYELEVDAIGLVAVRLDSKGNLLALVAGGLKAFHGGGLDIELENRPDVVLWKDENGEMHGAVQGLDGDIPGELIRITDDWLRLSTLVY